MRNRLKRHVYFVPKQKQASPSSRVANEWLNVSLAMRITNAPMEMHEIYRQDVSTWIQMLRGAPSASAPPPAPAQPLIQAVKFKILRELGAAFTCRMTSILLHNVSFCCFFFFVFLFFWLPGATIKHAF